LKLNLCTQNQSQQQSYAVIIINKSFETFENLNVWEQYCQREVGLGIKLEEE
jgi:hypothetical protein